MQARVHLSLFALMVSLPSLGPLPSPLQRRFGGLNVGASPLERFGSHGLLAFIVPVWLALFFKAWWAQVGSNHRPLGYQPSALAN